MLQALTPAIYAALFAFAINIVLCPIVIPYLHKLKFGQFVRDDGPKTHLKKTGTPTMGGIMIIASLLLVSVFYLKNNNDGVVVCLMTVGYGIIGLTDDMRKIKNKRSLGLTALEKFSAQLVLAGLFIIYLYFGRGDTAITQIYLPFSKGLYVDMRLLYIPFILCVILGTVNGANFTDGLDGQASGVTVLICSFFVFVAWALHSPVMPLAGAAVGSLLGFLLFNSHPARVFMGDTGSLALGAFVASIAVLTKMPLFIIIVAFIYLMEVMSVIIQVTYFKLTGQRFFKMAPIHHSFELSGWSETKIVALFYIITAVLCLVGYLGAQYIA